VLNVESKQVKSVHVSPKPWQRVLPIEQCYWNDSKKGKRSICPKGSINSS